MKGINVNLQFESISQQEQTPLLQSLIEYSNRDIACFDVPGHVRNQGVEILNYFFGESVMRIDINSSPYMDNVSNPCGVIKEAQELLAKAYKADRAFFITNGTTQGIHAMMLSVINEGDKVLLPRNVHKSAINALIFSGGVPVYIQPEYDDDLGISLNLSVECVRKSLEENEDVKVLFLLNPTYYGACTDLKEIVKICHERNVLVLVDEAHGAHFPFYDKLPPSAMECGADMSAVSIHKTGGALTQASALLLNSKNIEGDKLLQTINMLQSTSASYLLMASIDGARSNLVTKGEVKLSKALNLARYAKAKINKIPGMRVVSDELLHKTGVYFVDETKLCINVKGLGISGYKVYELLYKDFSVQVELGDMYNILALVSIGTTKEDIDKLIKSLSVISKSEALGHENKDLNLSKDLSNNMSIRQITPIVAISPRNAFYSKKEEVTLDKSIGRICAECIMAYPPGIPIISPGEVITKEILDYIKLLKQNNAYMTDMKDKDLKNILVVKK
ncbi:aminotransferase class I/II-fold pyridoxal phosphate-dependent enzyme [Terrisporobacter sp.]|uniref:aminotransferase class I/II-fold pyridoxal phosphate-dependent enzyme n=1 Tax=Terrisporobacter sp. TaxID=1965305 RepID=UPI00261CDF27|nr:aminotransferase class I/II-fold pyridoxal phosphate-dependent enzyme [Terrisporobacter sp.]